MHKSERIERHKVVRPHRLLFDLRPIPRIVSIVEIGSDPSLSEQSAEIKRLAKRMLGSADRKNVRPSSENDLMAMKTLLEQSATEILVLLKRVTEDLLEFIQVVLEYFSLLRSVREFTEDEHEVRLELEQLMSNMRAVLAKNMDESDPAAGIPRK